jgi:hypothetical protein
MSGDGIAIRSMVEPLSSLYSSESCSKATSICVKLFMFGDSIVNPNLKDCTFQYILDIINEGINYEGCEAQICTSSLPTILIVDKI